MLSGKDTGIYKADLFFVCFLYIPVLFLSKVVRERQVKTLPIELVKDYDVTLLKDGNLTAQIQIRDNGQRLNRLDFSGAEADEVRITVFGTYGLERARIYEVRIY